jgi:DNA polymerase III alpha subunit (gram-positive type)
LLRSLDSHSLDALAKHFGLEIVERHRAASDARATAELFLRLLVQLESAGVRTLNEVRRFRGQSESDLGGLDLQLTVDV